MPTLVVEAPEDPSPSSSARKAAIRTRLDELARESSTVKCLPVSTSFADGKFDELMVLVEVDAAGVAKASIPSTPVAQRVSKKADACILAVLGNTRFAAGAGAVKVSHTLRFD